MNELQLSLVGLGVLAILLVVVYNRWLERKYRKAQEPEIRQTAQVAAVTASAEDGRQEPSWDGADSLGEFREGDHSSRTEPELPLAEAVNMPEPLPALSDVEAWVDAIAMLRFYEPRSAGSIRDTIEQMGVERFGRIECYTGDDWHLSVRLPAEALVSNVRCRLQLATRRGPVSPDVLHEWVLAIERLAQVLSAGLSVESEAAIIERAASLDHFCGRVDALISLNLRARDPATMVPRFDQILSGAGLSGCYPAFARLSAIDQAVEYQVLADESLGLVSLTMDFPHVNRPDLVVADMLLLARTLAQSLDADIVDDSGRPLGEEGMALLSNQVVRLGAMLQAQGIEPGSALARRLFS